MMTIHRNCNRTWRGFAAWLATRLDGTRRQQNLDCLLLQLPPELLLMIFHFSSTTSKIFLSQTCSDLRALLPQPPSHPRSRVDAWDFLTVLVRLRPDLYPCDLYFSVHKVSLSDIPSNPQTPPCGKKRSRGPGYFTNPGYFAIHRRHVQLASQ